MRRSSRFVVWLTFATFLLRIADLTRRSLWLDEGFTVLRITGAWNDLITNTVFWNGIRTTDTNPQFYFAALKTWAFLSGDSDFTLKLFSSFSGVVFVPLVYAMTRRATTARAGVVAAIFASVSPLVEWYSQEVRMYSLVICLATASTLALQRAYDSKTYLAWSTWIMLCGVSLLTHYSFVGFIFAHLLWLVYAYRENIRNFSSLLPFALALVVVGLVVGFLIDTPQLLQRLRSGAEYSYEFKPLQDVVGSIVSGLLFGVNRPDPTDGAISWSISILMMLCVTLWMWHLRQSRKVVLWVLSVVVTIGVWFALSFIKPNFAGVRHLMLVAPMVFALLASMIDAFIARSLWAKAAGVAFAAVWVGVNVYGIAFVFIRTPNFQDDWRSMAKIIQDEWRVGDVIIGNAGAPIEVLQRYLGGLPARIRSIVSMSNTDEPFASSRRVWFVNTGGGDYGSSNAPEWINSLALQQRYNFIGRTNTIQVVLLDKTSSFVDTLPSNAKRVEIANDNNTKIIGYWFSPSDSSYPRSSLGLSVFWQRGSDDFSTDSVSIRLKRGEQIWLDWSLPNRLPQNQPLWTLRKIYRVEYNMPVPLGLPIQQYDLELIVRSGEKGEVVQQVLHPLSNDDLMCCVRIARASTSEERWRASDVKLVTADYSDVVKPGQQMPVALTWLATQDNIADWQIQLKLETLIGGLVSDVQQNAGVEGFTPSVWRAGELTRDQLTLKVPHHALAGWYRLSLRRYRNGVDVDGTLIGFVRVEEYPRSPVARVIQFPTNASVGDLALLGYSVNEVWSRGKTFAVHTYWRTDTQPRRDGKLFLHIVGPDGKLVSQDDNSPFDNTRSTLTLRPGDGIDQLHRVELKPDLPSGTYTLFAGVYDAEGDQSRWPAQQDGQPAKHDLLKLGSFVLP
jgi:4-amino-4-deoxy-L-arabinose transferase-like glycosyltransferase